jgi:hypothetical protein
MTTTTTSQTRKSFVARIQLPGLALLLLLSFPAAANAKLVTASDGHGGLIVTGEKGKSLTVDIPERIDGLLVTGIGASAFEDRRQLMSVTIPGSVTSIGDSAFEFCTSLTGVTIPSSVTSIGENAFESCYSLTSITIPSSVTSIGEGAFGFSGLTKVTIRNGVTTIGFQEFVGCYSLTSVTIPNSVTSIGDYAFEFCSRLKSAQFDGNAPTMGSDVFEDCASDFTVYYETGATGFTSPTWTDSSGDTYPAQSD